MTEKIDDFWICWACALIVIQTIRMNGNGLKANTRTRQVIKILCVLYLVRCTDASGIFNFHQRTGEKRTEPMNICFYKNSRLASPHWNATQKHPDYFFICICILLAIQNLYKTSHHPRHLLASTKCPAACFFFADWQGEWASPNVANRLREER